MSGFLHNLVTKSLDPAALIRPRLLSRFEPLPEHATRVPTEAVEQHARVPDATGNAPTAGPNVTPGFARHATPEAGAEREQHAPTAPAVGTLAVRASVPVQHGSTLAVAPAPPEAHRSEEPRHAPSPERAPSPAPLLIERTTERVTVERLVVPEQTPVSPATPSREVVSVPLQPHVTPPNERPVTHLDSRSPHSAAANDTKVVVIRERSTDSVPAAGVPRPTERPGLIQPHMLRRSEPARTITASAASPAVPTIHVTIGRIEVRATQQPGLPARARQEPAARLSLDDYLRQRARGGGR